MRVLRIHAAHPGWALPSGTQGKQGRELSDHQNDLRCELTNHRAEDPALASERRGHAPTSAQFEVGRRPPNPAQRRGPNPRNPFSDMYAPVLTAVASIMTRNACCSYRLSRGSVVRFGGRPPPSAVRRPPPRQPCACPAQFRPGLFTCSGARVRTHVSPRPASRISPPCSARNFCSSLPLPQRSDRRWSRCAPEYANIVRSPAWRWRADLSMWTCAVARHAFRELPHELRRCPPARVKAGDSGEVTLTIPSEQHLSRPLHRSAPIYYPTDGQNPPRLRVERGPQGHPAGTLRDTHPPSARARASSGNRPKRCRSR